MTPTLAAGVPAASIPATAAATASASARFALDEPSVSSLPCGTGTKATGQSGRGHGKPAGGGRESPVMPSRSRPA